MNTLYLHIIGMYGGCIYTLYLVIVYYYDLLVRGGICADGHVLGVSETNNWRQWSCVHGRGPFSDEGGHFVNLQVAVACFYTVDSVGLAHERPHTNLEKT